MLDLARALVALSAATLVSACSCPPNIASVHVTVLDPDGAGVNGANVTIRSGGAPAATLTSTSNPDGGAESGGYMIFGGVDSAASSVLHVDAPGFRTVERPLTDEETRGAPICGEHSVNATVRLERP